MLILFISDVHLCNKKPYVTECFLHFIYYRAINAKALYILGDLFEIWVGDDDPNPLHVKIAHALKYLRKHHISCYFIHGNHDFLLGKKYAINCGITLLPNQYTFNFFGYRLVILHGDNLCINDNNYQIFRKYARTVWMENIFLSLPLSIRLYIGRKIQKNKKKYRSIVADIDQEEVAHILSQTNADIMIHGHIHQAKMHYKVINNTKILERIALGSWENSGSMIEISKKGINLTEFSLKND